MEEEGHDPATFKFELSLSEAKTPSKRTKRAESVIENDTDDTPAMEDMIVQDDAEEEEDSEHTTKKDMEPNNQQTDEGKMDVDENEKLNRKRDLKDDSEATKAKKPCLDREDRNDDDQKVENNTDAEDSINLDIGDDELLNEEVCFYFFSVTVKLPTASSKFTNGFMMEVD